MPLVTTSVPNLVGGVSQQPASQRLPNQCEAQENALPLLVGGLIKRPPSIHLAELKTYGTDGTDGDSVDLSGSFTHFVTRDSTEEFLVSLTGTANTIHVNDVAGNPKNVTTDLGLSVYLTSATPQTSFRAITIADVTFLVNTDIAATMKTDAADLSPFSRAAATAPNEGLIWIRSSGQGISFKAKVQEDAATTESIAVASHTPSPDLLGTGAYGYPPNPPSTSDVAAALAVGTDIEDCAVGLEGITVYHDEGDGATTATVEVKATTMDLVVAGGSTNTTDTIDFASVDYNTLGEVVDRINALDKGFVAVLVGSPTSAVGSGDLTITSATDCLGVSKIQTLLRDAGGLNSLTNFTAESSGSVVFVTNTSEDFQLTVEDSLGQNAHKLIKGSVQNFSDLPPIAKNNMIVLVKGDPESEVDDYYVKFEVNGDGGEDFGEGIWLETVGPGIVYQWDYDTLPHILIRQADGTFIVKRADGTTPGSGVPVGADYGPFKFTPREAGSNLTNPLPSFVDRTINDISFFKNRIAILSGEDCALSEAAELFNFFRTTTTQLLDSSPIDVGVGGTEINKIEKAVPFSDRLVLFSERTQFVLQGEAILSPATASITQVTNYDVTTTVTPVLAGSALFFAFNRGSYSGVREFYKTSETDINFEAVDSTAQVPKYIPGIIEEMTVSTHEDILAVLSRTAGAATNELSLYKYFKTDQGRVQSAWFKFDLSNCEIVNVRFIAQSLYLVIKRGTKTFLERMDLQTGLVDTGKSYVTTIDRRTLITGQSGFTLELPYTVESGDTMQVVSSDGEVMTIKTTGSTTIELYEEFAASESFYVGIPYTMRYQLTEPVLKRPKPEGGYEMIAVGRHQLRYMTVVYDETAYFSIRVTPEAGGSDGTPITYPFSGRFLSTGGFLGAVPAETGDFRFPVFAQSDSIKIEILNDSPLPSNIQSIEFEANYVTRSTPRFGA